MNRSPRQANSLRNMMHWAKFGVFTAMTLWVAPIDGVATAPTTAPSTLPATAPSVRSFKDPAGLVRIDYPAGWHLDPDPDYVLSLASGSGTFTLDIPDLPPHIPDMIPLGLVVNGYINDLKKSHPGVKVSDETSPAIPKAKSRSLHSSWSEKDIATVEIATLVVHGDHVFILRIVAPADQLAAARSPFNGIIHSLRWLK
jgi:hypothetical protein